MKKPAKEEDKRYRLSLELTQGHFDKLTTLEEKSGNTKAEIVRNALRLYAYVAEKALEGHTFSSFDKDGNPTNVVFLELT